MKMNEIVISNVSKNFRDVKALDRVSLHIGEKKIFGLLGRNGAGKSTLLNIIANRIFADEGTVTIDGESNIENDRVLRRIYFMSEKSYYPDTMRVRDVYKFAKEFNPAFDVDRANRISETFELNTKKKIKTLSTGYTSIFKVVMALSFDLPFILMDEPVLGLDAYHRELFYRLLLESYAENPRTFILSTHLIEEVSRIIEEVIIIKNGVIIEQIECEKLLRQGYSVSGRAGDVDEFVKDKKVIGTDTLGGLKIAQIMGDSKDAAVAENLEISKLDLQKLFIILTQKEA